MTPKPRDIAGKRPCLHRAMSRWTPEQIRAARRIELAPRLQKRGLALRDRGGDNFEVEQFKGLFLKACYWRWPDHDLAGNSIDFYVNILGLSFADAMRELMQ